MFCHTCDLEIKHSLHICPFCGGKLSFEPLPPQEQPASIQPEIPEASEVREAPVVPETPEPEPAPEAVPQSEPEPAPEPEPEIITFVQTSSEAVTATPQDESPTAFVSFGHLDNENEIDTAESEPTPKKKAPLRIIIPVAAVAVLVVAALYLVNFLNLGLSHSFRALTADIAARRDASLLVLSDSIGSCFANGELIAAVTFTDEYGDSISGHVSYASSPENGLHRLSLDADFYGTPVDASLIVDSEHAAIGSSSLGDMYYGLRFNSFDADFEAFAENAGIYGVSSNDLSQYIDILNSIFNNEQSTTIPEETATALTAIFAEFFTDLQSSETREKLTIAGKNVNATTFTYSITLDDMIALSSKLLELSRTDLYLREALTAFMLTEGIYYEYESYAAADSYGVPTFQPLGFTEVLDAREPVDYLLDELQYLLETLPAVCSGDMSVRLVTAKGRLCGLELTSFLDFDGSLLRLNFSFDFGLDINDDWSFNCVLQTSGIYREYSVVWAFEDSGGTAESMITLTAGDRYLEESVTLQSSLKKDTGVFLVALYDDSGSAVFKLKGSLSYDNNGFSLKLDTTPQLQFELSGKTSALIETVEYINLDEWDMNTLILFERAVYQLYESIYMYPAVVPSGSEFKITTR